DSTNLHKPPLNALIVFPAVRISNFSLFLICLYFFQRFRYLRDLHSFPTRRSSDLVSGGNPVLGTSGSLGGLGHFALTARVNAKRSEEHTSELQSHLNLVCRLLLEKKKTKTQQSAAANHCHSTQ